MDDTRNDITSPLPPEGQERADVHDDGPIPPTVHEHQSYQPAPAAPVAPRHSHVGIVVAAVIASLIVGGLAGAAGSYAVYRSLPASEGGSRSQQVEIVGNETDEVVTAVAAVAVPSVVNITTSAGGDLEPVPDEGLPEDHPEVPDVPMESEGSGVAYKEGPDGGTYIITNNHVIEGGSTFIVTDSNGDRYEAELVGGDSESDIAVLLVDADLPLLAIGDADDVEVGELAVAIGSPYGLQASVTSGVVSATHRALTEMGGDNGEYPYVDAIQTDAAINSGNSGGALVNRKGELIGIPSVIYTDTGSSSGIGFAIPVDRATNAADQLIEKGSVDTPFLGVLGQTVNPAFAEQEGLPVEEGAFIVEITEGTEAEKAGLQPEDIIVGVDDERITSMDDLIMVVRRHSVGDEVTLTLWRAGEETELQMKVGAKPTNVDR